MEYSSDYCGNVCRLQACSHVAGGAAHACGMGPSCAPARRARLNRSSTCSRGFGAPFTTCQVWQHYKHPFVQITPLDLLASFIMQPQHDMFQPLPCLKLHAKCLGTACLGTMAYGRLHEQHAQQNIDNWYCTASHTRMQMDILPVRSSRRRRSTRCGRPRRCPRPCWRPDPRGSAHCPRAQARLRRACDGDTVDISGQHGASRADTAARQ